MPFLRTLWRRAGARTGILGLAAGLAAGSALGAVALGTGVPTPPDMRVLHVAPVLAIPGSALELSAGTLCDPPDAAGCQVARALLRISTPAGGWASIAGVRSDGAFRFTVPAELVPDAGFSYYLELKAAMGRTVLYPSSGASAPFRVMTTAGATVTDIPSIEWDAVRGPDRTALSLRFGSAPGEVGRTPGGVDRDPLGPSSFDVGRDGSLYVADWVNDRVEVFSPDGTYVRSVPLPVHRTVDLAVDEAELHVLTLGSDGRAYRLSALDGRVLGSRAVTTGVAVRIESAAGGPRVLVGPGQWAAAYRETSRLSAAPVPVEAAAVSQEVSDGSLAARWTGVDGAPIGALVRLPSGVRIGPEYAVETLPDGGAAVTRGLWDDTHSVVGVFRFGADGTLVDLSLLPEPSARMDAAFSPVRWSDGAVLVARDRRRGIVIDVFEVVGER